MGFGPVIATALSVVVLMAAGYLLVGGVTHSADASGASIKAAADLENQKLKTQLSIDYAGGNTTAGMFSFHLSNLGAEKIDQLGRMDVIVKMTGESNEAWYVPRDTGGQNPAIYWTNDTIKSTTPGIGDVVNPGILDPGEYVNIIVYDTGGFPSHTAWVQITAPNGVSASADVLLS